VLKLKLRNEAEPDVHIIPLRPHIWLDALNVGQKGKEARDYIAAHLIFDLLTTAFVFQKIAPYILPTLRKVTQ
jgi:hypothetical protein